VFVAGVSALGVTFNDGCGPPNEGPTIEPKGLGAPALPPINVEGPSNESGGIEGKGGGMDGASSSKSSTFIFPVSFDFYRVRQFQINHYCLCCVVDDLVLHIAFAVSTIQVASGFQLKSLAHFLKAITTLSRFFLVSLWDNVEPFLRARLQRSRTDLPSTS
jgi:hypothetical protein